MNDTTNLPHGQGTNDDVPQDSTPEPNGVTTSMTTVEIMIMSPVEFDISTWIPLSKGLDIKFFNCDHDLQILPPCKRALLVSMNGDDQFERLVNELRILPNSPNVELLIPPKIGFQCWFDNETKGWKGFPIPDAVRMTAFEKFIEEHTHQIPAPGEGLTCTEVHVNPPQPKPEPDRINESVSCTEFGGDQGAAFGFSCANQLNIDSPETSNEKQLTLDLAVSAGQLPNLPEPTSEERITMEVRSLVKTQPTEIALEMELKRISKSYNVGIKNLKNVYKKAELQWQTEQQPAPNEPTEEEIAEQKLEAQVEADEMMRIKRAGEVLSQKSNIFEEFAKDLHASGYIADHLLAYSLLISHGARLLPNSTGFMLVGASASGKSDAAYKASKFLPTELVQSITSVSAQAFYYLGDLQHKYLLFGEMHPVKDGEDDYRQTALRQLISENRIIRNVVEKVDGTNACVEKSTDGPCVIVATTTSEQTSWNDELVNRLSWIRTNDSETTTNAVFRLQAAKAKQPWAFFGQVNADITARWQAYHRELQPIQVTIPFSDLITPKCFHVTARRLFALVINYVTVSALLHQKSRNVIERNGQRYVQATAFDYEIAFDLLTANAPRVLEACSGPASKALLKLQEHFEKTGSLTTGQIQQALAEPGGTVRRWLGELTRAGFLEKDGKNGKQNIYVVGQTIESNQDLGLVSPAVLSEMLKNESTSDVAAVSAHHGQVA